MQSIQVHGVSEEFATEMIFDACRANSARDAHNFENGYRVTFSKIVGANEHQACVYNPNGYLVAGAVVDEFDC